MADCDAALADFKAAAAQRGAYALQITTATAALDAANNNAAALLELQPELQRLLVNISCRLSQRDPALRPQRDALSALNSRCNAQLKALGLLKPAAANSSKADAATLPADCEKLHSIGPRHICEHGCYLRAYGNQSRCRVLTDCDEVPAASSPNARSPKRQRSDSTSPTSPTGRVVTSRFFAPPSPAPSAEEAASSSSSSVSTQQPWRPPHSPFGLLEELLWDRPWALLLCCILLNQTTRQQVDPVLSRLLDRFPDAASLAAADVAVIEEILRPLGLHRRRARSVILFSSAFLKGAWRKPEELPGVGRYGADAHAIFCEGQWATCEPDDHALRWYVDWIRGLG